MTVCWFVLNEMLTGVVPSQVLAAARAYAEALPEVSVRVVFLEPARVAFGSAARRRVTALRRMWPGGRVSLVPYVGRFGESSPARFLRYWLAARERTGDLVLHCRGPEATLQAASAVRGRTGARVVFDARGSSAHEAELRLAAKAGESDPDAFARGRELDRRAVEAADAVVAVSEPLLREISGGQGRLSKRAAVVPCCVTSTAFSADARAEIRARLGVADDELLVVHVSSEARWEAFDLVADLFRAVAARRSSRLLFVTTLGREVVTAGFEPGEALLDRVSVTSAAPQDVTRYLSAADVGLLVRRPHPTHEMASPIKFAEYLAAGLSVAVSEGIGDLAGLVERSGLGVAVPSAGESPDLEAAAACLLERLGQEDARRRALRVCEERFVWARYVPALAWAHGLAEAAPAAPSLAAEGARP